MYISMFYVYALLLWLQIKLFSEQGSFPYSVTPTKEKAPESFNWQSFVPRAAMSSMQSICSERLTGLVYRRMFLLPPTPSGFWSKFISLCLQKKDFGNIIATEVSEANRDATIMHGNNVLRCGIGPYELNWTYWKTGIILYMNGLVST